MGRHGGESRYFKNNFSQIPLMNSFHLINFDRIRPVDYVKFSNGQPVNTLSIVVLN